MYDLYFCLDTDSKTVQDKNKRDFGAPLNQPIPYRRVP